MLIFKRLFVMLLLCAFGLALLPGSALAQDAPAMPQVRTAEDPLQAPVWAAQWGQPGWGSFAATSLLLGGALAMNIGFDNYAEPRWRGPILADRFLHESLRASTPEGMELAGHISDILLGSLIAAPLVVEPGLLYLKGDDATAAGRLALVNAQSMALVLFTTSAIKYAVARQRPPIGECWDDPTSDESCARREAVSFPSGHTSMAFVGAGLICMNHEVFSPLENAWDNVACYTALGAALSTGVLRMVAHQHYSTDVLIGAALGLAAGYVLPKVLYFGLDDGDPFFADDDAALTPTSAPIQLLSFSSVW
ncbi:phosphatase PAP2 family protein [Bradymonas sediminis]|uniref:Uncharacterized protein n=1 Tax=Bradymonas sediminis TaxID=1548548 RepID=A0A2Z4FPK2_9DELT|nr:phosphatase PAP2 family protein [Bradymonas sediminis]AWV90598.1 hypothetical protein DN745_15205 [Bradymonas sediminis]TDP62404.1 PAP2 superfamily protein [Bradymonas sediminis]